jgi:hypothetical protein
VKAATYLASIAGAALMIGLSAPASATTLLQGSVSHVDVHNSGNGLLIYANPLAASNFSFSLDMANPTTVISNFLQIGTRESSVELFEDTVAKAITVFFSFDNPFSSSAGAVSGQTTGFYTPSLFGSCGVFAGGCGAVNFNASTFTFGPNDTGSFTIELADAVFTTPGSANISARFTLNSEAQAPVPEPATWAMMMLGFGIVGGAMRRRSVQFRLA